MLCTDIWTYVRGLLELLSQLKTRLSSIEKQPKKVVVVVVFVVIGVVVVVVFVVGGVFVVILLVTET